MTLRAVTIACQKGGVGKSTIATLLAGYLDLRGQRVLALDFDHQGDFSRPLIKEGKCLVSAHTSNEVFTDDAFMLEDDAPFVLMQPDPLALMELERQPERYTEFVNNLRRFFKRHAERFDIVVIDTNPVQDIRVLSAMLASNFVLAPITLTGQALEGLRGMFNNERTGISVVQAQGNRRLRFLGMLPVMVDMRNTVDCECLELLMGDPAYRALMLASVDKPTDGGQFLRIKRATLWNAMHITGETLWNTKNRAAPAIWKEVEPVMQRIAQLLGVA